MPLIQSADKSNLEKLFLETDKLEWPNDPMCGSKRKWKTDMLDPTTWGDKVVLSLASNLLEVDIIIIPAFRESGDQVTGVTTVKPLIHAKHQPIHLFHFSEYDFTSPHYEIFINLSLVVTNP